MVMYDETVGVADVVDRSLFAEFSPLDWDSSLALPSSWESFGSLGRFPPFSPVIANSECVDC